ncbi:MAG: hypothetical protein U5K76_01815 [Woeseiaceae bacterium]|nr:hypothetical protein [Woeseiaceae bacterium]
MPADLTPIEALDRRILALCTRINAATSELLVMIREFDERAGFVQWGLSSCAEWLAWRCDLSLTTAREKVRVAHALKCLAADRRGLRRRRIVLLQGQGTDAVANRDNEAPLLAFALRHTAVTVAERCRELRCGRDASIGTAERAWANRSLRIRRDRERSLMTVTVELPLDTGELLEKALDKARDDAALEVPDLVDTAWPTRQADAFVNLLNGYLAGDGDAGSDNFLVTRSTSTRSAALQGTRARAAVPLEAVKRHCWPTGRPWSSPRPPRASPWASAGSPGSCRRRWRAPCGPGTATVAASPVATTVVSSTSTTSSTGRANRRNLPRQPAAPLHPPSHLRAGARGRFPDRQGFPRPMELFPAGRHRGA